MLTPRYKVEEDWNNTGDVTVYFYDATQRLSDQVDRELRQFVPQLSKEQRTIYHLETIMDGIFVKMYSSGKIKFNNKRWQLAEEV